MQSRSTSPWTYILPLIGAWLLVHIPFISAVPLWGSSEAREAQVIWTIGHTGEWILPLRNGIVPSKPPLFHWLGASIHTLFGLEALTAARLISLLASAGTIGLLLFVTLRFAREMQLHERSTYVTTSIIITTTYLFFGHAADAKVDMVFTFFVTLAVAGYLVHASSKETWNSRAHQWLWCGATCAALTKGPLGFILPLLLAFSARAYLTSLKEAFREFTRIRVAPLFSIIIVLSWYWAAYRVGGDAFLDRHLFFENIKRVTGGEDMNSEPLWFYLPSFLRTLFPWSIIGIVICSIGVKRKLDRSPAILGFFLFGVGLLFFSIPSGKRHSYLLPLVPWFVFSCALLLERLNWRVTLIQTAFFIRTLGVVCASIFGAMLLLFYTPNSLLLYEYSPQTIAIVHALVIMRSYFEWGSLIIGAFLLLYLRMRPCGRQVYFEIVLCTCLYCLVCPYYLGLSLKGALKGFERAAPLILSQLEDNSLTVIKGVRDEYFDPLFYYFKKQVKVAESEGECIGMYLTKLETFHASPHRTEIIRVGEVPNSFETTPKRELVVYRCN